jgi:hypothetical protein
MRRTRFFSILALIALVAGCAGPSARVGSSESGEDGSALPAAREFSGTWHGAYWALPALGNSYGDEADCTLRIKDDATYTVKCERAKIGANDLARASSWSGRVATKGARVILQDKDGLWPNIVLRRSGNNILYGTSLDPLVGATVEIEFEHEPTTAAGAGGE